MRTIKTPKNLPEFIVVQHYMRGHNGILYEGHIKFFLGLAVLEKNSYWHKKLSQSTKWKTFPLIYLYKSKKMKPKDVLFHFGPKVYAAYKIAYKDEALKNKKNRLEKLNMVSSVDSSTVNINKDMQIEERIKNKLCIAKKKNGDFCKGKAKEGSEYCVFHKEK